MKPLTKEEIAKRKRFSIISVIASLFISSIVLLISKNPLVSIISFFIALIAIFVYFYFKRVLVMSSRIKKIESVFPDFLQLMSSNLRAGMTLDKAFLLSSRPEFAPLDDEILKTGKDLATSKNIERALLDLSQRIGSEKIHKTILLIISGIKAGGDLAILLEETSVSMREREFIQKKAYSNILMYIIFIFLVVSIFAPALFSLSNILVEVLTKILGSVPDTSNASSSVAIPFATLSKISISTQFTNYFSIIFIITMDFLASLILGLVSKGEEKEGLRYFPVILILSLAIFFLAKMLISNFMAGLL
jgi:archaellum biogenesis protein FlaJ (TadC family)